MSAMSHYLESGLIGYIFKDLAFNPPTGIYIGLVGNYNSGSLESGLFTQELSGGSYARVSGGLGTSKWAAPASSGQTHNLNDLTFPAATSNWAKNFTNGDTFSFASGDLDIFFK